MPNSETKVSKVFIPGHEAIGHLGIQLNYVCVSQTHRNFLPINLNRKKSATA